jgi:hypothetical protein
MRLFTRKGRSSQPLYVCSSQQFVDSEDFMLAMTKHVKPCGSVHNMYIDFENTNIPVTNVSEIRVLSQMAAAYHNACLAQNLAGERDLYGMPYNAGKWPEIVSDKNELEGNTAIGKVSKDKSNPLITKNKVTKAKISKSSSNLFSSTFGRSSAKQDKQRPAPAAPAHGPSTEGAGIRVCGYAIKNSGLIVAVNRRLLHVCVKESRVKIRTSGVARAGQDGRGPYRNKWREVKARGDGAQHAE